MQNRPESSLNLCMIVKAQLKASSFTSPYSQPESFVLMASVFSLHFFLFKKQQQQQQQKTLVTVSQCYMDEHIIPLMEIVNSLRVRTMPHVISVTTQALHQRQPVNICRIAV